MTEEDRNALLQMRAVHQKTIDDFRLSRVFHHEAGRKVIDPFHEEASAKRFVNCIDRLLAAEPAATLHQDGYWTPKQSDAGRKFNDHMARVGRCDAYAVETK